LIGRGDAILLSSEDGQLPTQSKEKYCGVIHSSIEEAIVHAEKNLGSFRKPADPYYGTMRNNSGIVVGFELDAKKRWRLDFDPDPTHDKWVHVNEENFDGPPGKQKICHLVYSPMHSDAHVRTYYGKWTSRYGKK
jgi:hypothetical protein